MSMSHGRFASNLKYQFIFEHKPKEISFAERDTFVGAHAMLGFWCGMDCVYLYRHFTNEIGHTDDDDCVAFWFVVYFL